MYGNGTVAASGLPATGAFVTGQIGLGLAIVCAGMVMLALPKLVRRTKVEHRP